MGRRLQNFGSARAFTLTELIVVLGIIALLIAILMPALVRARQVAQDLACSARLRSLGQVLLVHAGDHRGYLPLAGNIVTKPDLSGFDDPQSVGDPSRQRYTYYTNDGSNVRVTAMPAALSQYLMSQPCRDDSWQDVDADIQAPGPVQDAFTCPSDQMTIDRIYGAPQWIRNYNVSGGTTYLNGWSSYGFNSEVFGFTDANVNGTWGHSRARGKLDSIPHPSETLLMADTYAAIEIWVEAPQLSLADVYLGTGGTVGNTIFDLVRHRGRMNILYVDGHVDSQPILSTGAMTTTGAIGTPGNSPSDGLVSVSIDKDFR